MDPMPPSSDHRVILIINSIVHRYSATSLKRDMEIVRELVNSIG
jgi:hypothetical protein